MAGLLGTPLPLVAAPMAGGATTLALLGAVAAAGAFPFLPAAYRSPEAVAEDLAVLRHEHVGVNVFVPSATPADPDVFAAYVDDLRPEFDRYGLTPGLRARHDDDHWHDKLAVLHEHPVPVVSFTFGLPTTSEVRALQRLGTRVLATVTTPAEARAAEAVGVDGLVVQGPAAGAHSATFDPHRHIAWAPTADVVAAVRAAVPLPVVAAGGVDGPGAVRELVSAGVEGVAVGTLLLRTDESGASPAQKAALAAAARAVPEGLSASGTVVTRAYTGRPARALRNGFIDRHPDAPVAYPELHHLTRPLRAAAAERRDGDVLQVWAGSGYHATTDGPASGVVATLVSKL